MSLRKQGASQGATTAFLISTPESGIDSISITYALLDPIMTIMRPIAAFATAAVAGIVENLFHARTESSPITPDLSCPVDGCCDGINCSPDEHRRHHTVAEKLQAGLRFAFFDLWGDLAGWFLVGILLAGFIAAFIPDDVFGKYLGAGLPAMLLMLVFGIPLYICATASTPIAAALILKGVSPGAALVFLLAGPATNITSLTVLSGILGKRATAIYLSAIVVSAVVFGLLVDQIYVALGVSAGAMIGHASEIIPAWAALTATFIILILSIKPVWHKVYDRIRPPRQQLPSAQIQAERPHATGSESSGCGPT